MRLLPLILWLAAGLAGAQSMPTPDRAALAADGAASTERSAPSVPSRPAATQGTPSQPAATDPLARPRPQGALSPDPRGGTWGGPAPQVGVGLESVLNSGTPAYGQRGVRKVCPPGLVNRDNVCVAPAGAIFGN